MFFIDKCHWPQIKQEHVTTTVCIVHGIKTTQTTSILLRLASALPRI